MIKNKIGVEHAKEVLAMDKCIHLMAKCISNYQYHSNCEPEEPNKNDIENIVNSFMEKAKSEL
jgi:hypothetical protein